MPARTVSAAELARFDAMAARWWDPDGPMRALHRMNPARIGWIVERVERRFPGRAGLSLLDVGSGGGIAAEALATRGFQVLGIDAAAETIHAARAHAGRRGLPVAYRVATAETMLEEGHRFSVVTALEVIEHVPDPDAFLNVLGRLLEPGGVLFVSTLNWTSRFMSPPRSAPSTCCGGCLWERMTGGGSSRRRSWEPDFAGRGCGWRTWLGYRRIRCVAAGG